MAHTFLSLDMNLIPQATKDNVPTFWGGLFSSDGIKDADGNYTQDPTMLLIDGYNDNGDLVHPQETLSAWLQWESNPLETQELIISNAIEYTKAEYITLKGDVNSIWFVGSEVGI